MNWDEIARRYGLNRCPACVVPRDHERGELRLGVIHWRDRRLTRAGLRRYLMLIAASRLHGIDEMTEWQRLYALNVWAAQAAHDLHLRLPMELSLNDRARVRWLISHDPTAPVTVRRWSNRGLP